MDEPNAQIDEQQLDLDTNSLLDEIIDDDSLVTLSVINSIRSLLDEQSCNSEQTSDSERRPKVGPQTLPEERQARCPQPGSKRSAEASR